MKIVCYGVRPIEEPYFEKLNKYDFDLKLVTEFLTDDNVDEAEGMDAVLIRGNCPPQQRTSKFLLKTMVSSMSLRGPLVTTTLT